MSSAVSSVDKRSTFTYKISNEGNLPIWILINLPATDAFLKDVPMITKPIEMKPGKVRKFVSVVDGLFELQTASVVILDPSRKEALAVESASFYVPIRGKRLRTDLDLWESFVPADGQSTRTNLKFLETSTKHESGK